MRNLIVFFIIFLTHISQLSAQVAEGKCGNAKWSFDGQNLTIEKESTKLISASIPDYDLQRNLSPWVKKGLKIKKVIIGYGIERIGSCAFANCSELQSVEFVNDKSLSEIGWAAFLNCSRLFNFSIPIHVQKIETIAFANCSSLRSVKIPSQTHVDNQAFLSCVNLNIIEIAPTAILGHSVFSTEVKEGNSVHYKFFSGEIRSLPPNVTVANCNEYGLSKESVEKCANNLIAETNHNIATSFVDTIIPESEYNRNDTYALIIGNQNYRFVPSVPYANHDANIFAEYCKKALGIPAENIHLCNDATKHMIIEEEIGDWMTNEIQERNHKNLLVYYAGHGVPDIHDSNKAYILPTDVRGTKPQYGIALDDFYSSIGELAFNRVTVFMDACFSGINRNDQAVNEGLRAVEIEAEQGHLSTGNIVVFSAAQGNETAQGYLEQGHGLFTYFLLKELQENIGYLTYGKLATDLQKNVSKTAPTLRLRKKQTPTTTASDSILDSWENLFF